MNRLIQIRKLAFPKILQRISYLTITYLLYRNYKTQFVHCTNEIRQVNQQIFVNNILGNRQDYFFLVIYKEEVDGGYGEKEAILAAKKLQEIVDKLKIHCHVYILSRPSLKAISKLVNRVKSIKIYGDEDVQKMEIFFKTPHSDDYVYFPFKKHNFYEQYKQEKIMNRVDRFCNLFQIVSTKEEYDKLIFESRQQLDQPVFIKADTNDKQLKRFKKNCFKFLERKIINQNSKFIIINDKQLLQDLKLEDDDIFILRNDILQKYNNCEINSEQQIVPKFQEFTQKIDIEYESFKQWRKDNSLVKEKEFVKEKENLFNEFQQFSLPRIFYLKNSKKAQLAAFVRKVQSHNETKDKLTISLQLDPKQQNRIDVKNHIRLQVFFKLYQKYNHRCDFLISATNQLEEIIPHLNRFQSHFVLFNIFNPINYSKQLFPRTAKLYEKYFLKDEQFVERFEVLDKQIEALLNLQPNERTQHINYLSQDLDKIQEINLDYFQLLHKMKSQQIILYYTNDIMTVALLQVLKNIETKHKIFTISNLNQIPSLYTKFNNQNVLILNETAIGFPSQNDVNLNELREQVMNLIKQYL